MAGKTRPGRAIGMWAMVVLAVGVVAVLLLLIWKLRQTQGPTASRADNAQAARRSAPPPRREVRPSEATLAGASDVVSDKDLAAEAEVEDNGTAETEVAGMATTPLAELLAQSSGEIRSAAATCRSGYDVTAGSTQKTEFDFIVAFKGGQAVVEEVIPVGSDIENKKLEQCILDKVSNARWKTPRSRTFRKRWRQSISLADLTR